MTDLRDLFAIHAPITLSDAKIACGHSPDDPLVSEDKRSIVVGVLALMRYEYADEMLRQREED